MVLPRCQAVAMVNQNAKERVASQVQNTRWWAVAEFQGLEK